jgi:hypothetical protein
MPSIFIFTFAMNKLPPYQRFSIAWNLQVDMQAPHLMQAFGSMAMDGRLWPGAV